MKSGIGSNSFYNKLTVMYSDRPEFIKLAVNFFPIIGVLFLNWDYLIVIMAYIAETFVIGAINVFKILKAKGKIKNIANTSNSTNIQGNTQRNRIILASFFVFHFNLFVLFQTVFVIVLDNETFKISRFVNYDFILGIILFAFSHALAYRKNYIKKKEYLRARPDILMFLPYKRIFIQQFTIIFGSFLLTAFNSPVFMVIILILLKMLFDIKLFKEISENINNL